MDGSSRGHAELIRRGDERSVARSISWLEAGDRRGADVLADVFPTTGSARVVGVTGPPGSGKSTLVDRLLGIWRSRGRTVAVLAVDPSSPFSRGALLGDRVRMRSAWLDDGAFIRSVATRGALGGLATVVPAAVRVLDAAGFDRIVVETVGVGQSEAQVAQAADCTLLVTVPGAGDILQTMKAGVTEIADVFVVNKSDLPDAGRVAQDLRSMLAVRLPAEQRPPIAMVAASTGADVEGLVEIVESMLEAATRAGRLDERRDAQLRDEALRLLDAAAGLALRETLGAEAIERELARVRSRQLTPAALAEELVARAGEHSVPAPQVDDRR